MPVLPELLDPFRFAFAASPDENELMSTPLLVSTTSTTRTVVATAVSSDPRARFLRFVPST
ncbi:hypothetical protein BSN85_35200 [Bradyrhizobium brasilense]|nr:hypothetical protein BSN85_35200 [Bradyrhizobium brasilense]